MKKIFCAVFIFVFIFSCSISFAQMPVTVPGSVMTSPGLEKIGVIAAAKGKVELTTPGQVGRIASSGQPIFLGDEVKTDSKGHLQILLLDQTVFTIGPNSAIIIDEFIYDPKTNDGQIRASVTKGVFRYVSGKIAAKRPNNVSVKLPTATIGFRGTIVAGQVAQDGGSVAALLGPGENNNAGAQIGSFVMEGTGEGVGESQEVNRTGFGVRAGSDGGISGVFQLSETDIHDLTSGLSPSGSSGAGSGDPSGDSNAGSGDDGLESGLSGSAAEFSGDTAASTAISATDMVSFTDFVDATDDISEQAAQDASNQTAESSATEPSQQTLGLVTSFEDMQAIQGVTDPYHFAEENVCTTDPNISYKIFIDINFTEGSQSVGGGNSRIDVDNNGTILTFGFADPESFTSSSNPFSDSNIAEAGGASFALSAELTVLNEMGGTIGCIDSTAIAGQHSITLYDTSSAEPVSIATGTGEAPRTEGAAPPPIT